MDNFLLSDFLIKEVHLTSMTKILKGTENDIVMNAQVSYELYTSNLILFYDVFVTQNQEKIVEGKFKVECTYHTSTILNEKELVKKAVEMNQKNILDIVTHFLELLVEENKEVH